MTDTTYAPGIPDGCSDCGNATVTEPRVVRLHLIGVGWRDYSAPHCARCGKPRGDLARLVEEQP